MLRFSESTNGESFHLQMTNKARAVTLNILCKFRKFIFKFIAIFCLGLAMIQHSQLSQTSPLGVLICLLIVQFSSAGVRYQQSFRSNYRSSLSLSSLRYLDCLRLHWTWRSSCFAAHGWRQSSRIQASLTAYNYCYLSRRFDPSHCWGPSRPSFSVSWSFSLTDFGTETFSPRPSLRRWWSLCWGWVSRVEAFSTDDDHFLLSRWSTLEFRSQFLDSLLECPLRAHMARCSIDTRAALSPPEAPSKLRVDFCGRQENVMRSDKSQWLKKITNEPSCSSTEKGGESCWILFIRHWTNPLSVSR